MKPAPTRLPILMFHALDTERSAIAFDPASFHRLLARLHAHGFQTLDLGNAAESIRRGEPLPSRPCVITFDDGYQSVYTEAFPLLARYGQTATIFLTTGSRRTAEADARLPGLSGRPMLSWREIREMQRHGIAVGAHTLSHADLTRLDEASVVREVTESQAIIADAIGAPVPSFAYPFGRYDAASRAVVARSFVCACSDRLGLASESSDLYALERVEAYYFSAEWTMPLVTSRRLAWYLRARNVPRQIRRAFVATPDHSAAPGVTP